MKKKCKVIMLPTDGKANIQKNELNEIFNLTYPQHSNQGYISQHLYITSNDEIKENDWFYSIKYNRIEKFSGHESLNEREAYKIIATTDKLSPEPYQGHFEGIDCTNYLPQPSQQFIQKYIEEYNKGNIITDIMVEYVDNGEEGWSGSNEDGEPVWNEKFELKVNPKDNTITITKVKDSWNRNEVISFAEQYAKMVQEKEIQLNGYKVIHNQKWISENL